MVDVNTDALKISIITVCFNSENTLVKTIESVISQKYSNIEYIVVDGDSKDSTINILEKYKDYISKLISEPDKGIYDAMNKGIRLATGDIIGILNSDDIFYSDLTITEVVQAFQRNVEFDAVFGNIVFFKNDVEEKIVRKWNSQPYSPSFFDNGNVAPHPSLFVKKEVYNQIGLYFPEFKISSDYEFMLRAFKKYGYRPYFLDKYIVKMRMGGESTKSFKNIIIGNKEVAQSWQMNNIKPPLRFWFLRIFKKIGQYVVA